MLLRGADQLVQSVVAPDIFSHQGDLAGWACPCGSMNRAGLLVCRLRSGQGLARLVNCSKADFDTCPDAGERTNDLGQIVDAAEATAGAARHVASALFESAETLFCD